MSLTCLAPGLLLTSPMPLSQLLLALIWDPRAEDVGGRSLGTSRPQLSAPYRGAHSRGRIAPMRPVQTSVGQAMESLKPEFRLYSSTEDSGGNRRPAHTSVIDQWNRAEHVILVTENNVDPLNLEG